MRQHPVLHVYKLHTGTDFSTGCGAPIYAAADGRIIGFAPDMAQALGAIIQNNMEAVPLH